jgi:hypothetical protein
VTNEDEWLRTARRVLERRPAVVGLVALGAPVESTAVARRLAEAMNRLTGQGIALIPHWRSWRLGGSDRAPDPAVTELVPPPTHDALAAVAALEQVIAAARQSFFHVVVDLAGLPLRHPATLACVDAIAVVAAPGGVREEHLVALERLVPSDRNLGVMLVD